VPGFIAAQVAAVVAVAVLGRVLSATAPRSPA
jgi:hypothetical protein